MYLGFYPGLLAVAVVTDDGDVDRSISMDCRHPLKMRLFDFEADILDLLEATEEGMPAGVKIVGAGGLAGPGGIHMRDPLDGRHAVSPGSWPGGHSGSD